MDEMRAITLFVRAAGAGSFQRAAVDLAISPQAVGKAIRQLEGHLGVRLFHRTTRQNSLTTEGLAFLEAVRPGLEVIGAAVGRARAITEQVEGPLRVTAAHSARKVLAQPIAEFNARYPQVRFDLVMDNGFTDIVAEKIDVGFRAGPQPGGRLIARQLFAIQQILCAAPQYLATHGVPKSLAELTGHRCTGFRLRDSGRLLPWELVVDGELRRFDMPVSFCCNDPEAEVDAVVAGMGIGLLDSVNAAADIRAGRLVPLLPEHRSEHFGFHIFYAQRTNMPRRVRVFIDFMVERLRAGASAFRLDAAELQASWRRGARAATRKGG